MERVMNMDAVSDGRKYGLEDMVKVGCNDCAGCWDCCQGMEDTIVLDPLDIYRMTGGLKKTFAELLDVAFSLGMVDGLALPRLRVDGAGDRCVFLNAQGRCSIHAFRPGICRLFPLGRIYEEDSFWYFLQVHECKRKNKTKVRVRKWIDTPEPRRYESFVLAWHDFLKETRGLAEGPGGEEKRRGYALLLLRIFYEGPYDPERDFYEQFAERLSEAGEARRAL